MHDHMTITDDPTNPSSVILRGLTQGQLELLWDWCESRWGLPCSRNNPQGCWTWTWIPETATVVTLSSPEEAMEMKLIEPWNP